MASLSIPTSTHGRVGENWAQVWECAPMGGSAACLGYSLQKQAERGGGDAAPSRLMLSSLWPSPLLSERTADIDSMFWYLVPTRKFPQMQKWRSPPLMEHTSRRGCSDRSLTRPCLLPGLCGDMAKTATSPPTTVALGAPHSSVSQEGAGATWKHSSSSGETGNITLGCHSLGAWCHWHLVGIEVTVPLDTPQQDSPPVKRTIWPRTRAVPRLRGPGAHGLLMAPTSSWSHLLAHTSPCNFPAE